MEDLGEINTFFPLSELELLYVHTIISFWYKKKKKKDSDILWKHSDLASHGILKAYYWGTDSKFGGLTPGRENYGFLHLSMNPAAGKTALC